MALEKNIKCGIGEGNQKFWEENQDKKNWAEEKYLRVVGNFIHPGPGSQFRFFFEEGTLVQGTRRAGDRRGLTAGSVSK